MQRNSNLEHLQDMAMPRQNKKERGLMYKSSVPKAAAGTVLPTEGLDPGATATTGISTFIPQADPTKLKATSKVNMISPRPQTRAEVYTALQKAGRFAKEADGMPIERWNTLKPEETVPYLGEGFDYTIGNTQNPGGYKYWSLDSVPSKVRVGSAFDNYQKEKKRTVYPNTYTSQMKAKGGLLTTKPLTRKQLDASKRADDRKDSSLRKPNEVPGAASKSRSHRQ